MLAVSVARHRPPPLSITFASYALARDLPAVLPPPARPWDGPPRVVYQGTLSANGGHYDLRQLFGRIAEEGVELHVYPGRPAPEYEELAASSPLIHCHATLEPSRLFEALAGYDFGWAGFNASLNRAHIDTALPNKAFDYLGCGVPILTLDHRALGRLVEDHGVGVRLATLDGLADQLRSVDVEALRRRVAKARPELTVEANIHRIVELYEAVAA
jgi:glycosyltransferase involved in cell wall biosynthesis